MEPAFAAPNFSRRPRLGETLRFFGILSGAEVEGALDRQANDGGRLGTCLLDSGLVDEATLAERVAECASAFGGSGPGR